MIFSLSFLLFALYLLSIIFLIQASVKYEEHTLQKASAAVAAMTANMGGTDLLPALEAIFCCMFTSFRLCMKVHVCMCMYVYD